MWRKWLLTAGLTTLASAAHAQTAAQPTAGLEVTIYNANLALVDDTRQLDIAKGRQRLEFKDVSSAIRPETVTLSGPPNELSTTARMRDSCRVG